MVVSLIQDMAFETLFRRFSLLPGFIHTAAPRTALLVHGTASLVQTGNGESRKAHWLGNKQPKPSQQDSDQRGPQDRPPKRPETRAYRDLASLTLGEVEEAYSYFKQQLVPSPVEGWIAKNYFCQLPLKRRGDERPPVVFGRVKTCYPGDGNIHNIEEMEVYFPDRNAAPDLLHIYNFDISLQRPTQSYCIGVKVYAAQDEMADFSQSENIFLEKGVAPLYETGYIDLLDVTEQNQSALPWMYVIGSGWFASIPDSLQPEIREQLRNLVRWGKAVFNYHPRRYSLQYRSLNEELDFNYGFTEHFLVTPQDTGQVLKKLNESFDQIFMQGIE